MMVPEFCWWIFKGPIRRGKEALAHFAIATPQQGQNIFLVEFEITYNVLFMLNCTTHSSKTPLCVVQFNINKTLGIFIFTFGTQE